MSAEVHSQLPPAPSTLFDAAGEPRIGTYHGSVPSVDLRPRLGSGLAARALALFKLKRWCWGTVATQDVLVAFAMVDAGVAANAFCFAVDLKNGGLLIDHSALGMKTAINLVDKPGDGFSVSLGLNGFTGRAGKVPGDSAFEAAVQSGAMTLEAQFDMAGAPGPLAVLMPVKGGDLDFTQKTTLLPARGTLRIGDRNWDLSGGFGGFDYTHGLFARHTSWRWAFALGKTKAGVPVSLNLAEGISDASPGENAIWVGRELQAVGALKLAFDRNRYESPWHASTADGAVDLEFTPKGMHREDRNLGLVKAHFVQVAGVFNGTIRDSSGSVHEIEGLPGVAEDQDVVW